MSNLWFINNKHVHVQHVQQKYRANCKPLNSPSLLKDPTTWTQRTWKPPHSHPCTHSDIKSEAWCRRGQRWTRSQERYRLTLGVQGLVMCSQPRIQPKRESEEWHQSAMEAQQGHWLEGGISANLPLSKAKDQWAKQADTLSLALSLHPSLPLCLSRALDGLKTPQQGKGNSHECHSALVCDTDLRKCAMCVNDYVSCYWCAMWHYNRTAQKHTPH